MSHQNRYALSKNGKWHFFHVYNFLNPSVLNTSKSDDLRMVWTHPITATMVVQFLAVVVWWKDIECTTNTNIFICHYKGGARQVHCYLQLWECYGFRQQRFCYQMCGESRGVAQCCNNGLCRL